MTPAEPPTLCRSPRCRARIRWMRTEAAKRMPVNADPVPFAEAMAEPRGVFYLAKEGVLVPWAPTTIVAHGLDLYRAHWGSCVDRDAFRRR